MIHEPSPHSKLFVRTPSLGSHLIAWATRARREGKTMATHIASFRTSKMLVHARKRRGVVAEAWQDYKTLLDGMGAQYAIAERVVQPTLSQEAVMCYWLDRMVKKQWKYSNLELPLQAIDGLISKLVSKDKMGLDVILFRKLGDLWQEGVICSKTTNLVEIKAGLLPYKYEYGTPDDTWDYTVNHPAQWKVTHKTDNWDR